MLFSQSVSSASMMRCCFGNLGTAAELAQEFMRVEPEAQIGNLVVAHLEDLTELERRLVAGGLEAAVAPHVEIAGVRAGGDVIHFVNRVAAPLDVFDRDLAVWKRL